MNEGSSGQRQVVDILYVCVLSLLIAKLDQSITKDETLS
jgi:hypothetical protein